MLYVNGKQLDQLMDMLHSMTMQLRDRNGLMVAFPDHRPLSPDRLEHAAKVALLVIAGDFVEREGTVHISQFGATNA